MKCCIKMEVLIRLQLLSVPPRNWQFLFVKLLAKFEEASFHRTATKIN